MYHDYPRPNITSEYNGFYISYNNHDFGIYGQETTAIVLGQMQLFLVLNGDHYGALQAIASAGGLQGCIDYFITHIGEANKHSEHIAAYSGLDLLGQDNMDRIKRVA